MRIPHIQTLTPINEEDTMKRKNLFLMLLALLLVFTLAACGGSKATETTEKAPAATSETAATQPEATKAEEMQPTAAPTEAAEATAEPEATEAPAEATAEPTEEPTSSEFAKIEDVVDSYRLKGEVSYQVRVTPDDGSESTNVQMTFESEWTKADNPYGYNVATKFTGMDMFGTNGEENSDKPTDFQMIAVDDTAYMKLGDQWISTPRDQANQDDTMMINIDDYVTDMENLKKVGTETVNGIKTVHYTYKDDAMFQATFNEIITSLLKDNENVDDFEPVEATASSDLWIATKGNYPVKADFQMNATFKSKTTDKEIHIEGRNMVEVTEINGDVTIEPPADAPKPGEVNIPGFEPGTFPIPEQTTVEGSMAGMTSLTSKLSPDEINAFYDDALTKMGWTKAEGPMPTWSKDGNSFTLMVTPGDDGTTAILILVTPQQ